MCGRCASARNRDYIRRACAYRPRGKSKAVKPPWVSNCSSLEYQPCYNLSPQMNSSVLISSEHSHIQKAAEGLVASGECTEGSLGDRVLQPMKWGLVPSWRQDSDSKNTPLLNNCRLEGIAEKPSFSSAYHKGRRCVVVADGFFEWQKRGKEKLPYFIHFKDNEPTVFMKEIEDSEREAMETQHKSGDEELKGKKPCCSSLPDADRSSKFEEGCGSAADVDPVDKSYSNVLTGRMLTMAGFFDICMKNEEPLYTYTIVTVDAHRDFSQIHHRMPAVLDGEEAIKVWLDPSVSSDEAVKSLDSSSALTWYPVSNVVNNVRNKSAECIHRIDPSKEVSKSQKTLRSWFSQKTPKKNEESSSLPPSKKPKM